MASKNMLPVMLLVAACAAGELRAQETPAGPGAGPESVKKAEQIVIRKKGNSKERVTIVLDGDSVTVNGKPLKEFTNDSIEVKMMKLHQSFGLRTPGHPARPVPPVPPVAKFFDEGGGVKTLRGFSRHFRGAAPSGMLGVLTEKSDKGAFIHQVIPGSAAEKAGLQAGDVITRINDSTISDSEALAETVSRYKPDQEIKVGYLREGKENTVTARLGKNNRSYNLQFDDTFDLKDVPELRNFRFDFKDLEKSFDWSSQPRLGLQVQDTEDKKGVRVLEARENSAGARAGLQKDDIITSINGGAVNGVEDIRKQLKEVKAGDTVKVEYRRKKKRRSTEVVFSQKLKTSNL